MYDMFSKKPQQTNKILVQTLNITEIYANIF